jgi:hypothetical protein
VAVCLHVEVLVVCIWYMSLYHYIQFSQNCILIFMQADRIQQLYPEADRVRLQSGHCPHDDTPEEANAALLEWLGRINRTS